MWPQTELERRQAEEMRWQLHLHRLRLRDWEKIKQNFIPDGLTCPKCGADHCEVDGHAC